MSSAILEEVASILRRDVIGKAVFNKYRVTVLLSTGALLSWEWVSGCGEGQLDDDSQSLAPVSGVTNVAAYEFVMTRENRGTYDGSALAGLRSSSACWALDSDFHHISL